MIYTPDLHTTTYDYIRLPEPNETRNWKEDFPRRHFKFTFIFFVYCFICSVRVIVEKCLCFKRAKNHEQNAKQKYWQEVKQICHLLLPNNYVLIMINNKTETTLKVKSMFVLHETTCSPKTKNEKKNKQNLDK